MKHCQICEEPIEHESQSLTVDVACWVAIMDAFRKQIEINKRLFEIIADRNEHLHTKETYH